MVAQTNRSDVIILGGGTMGTAAAWALGRRGVKALVLEQFHHIHDKGSHGGDTRIIRHAYAESPEYVPLVQRADELWQELEALSGETILIRCGGLELAAPGYSHAQAARTSALEHNLAHEWLAPAEVRARWPQFHVTDDWDALYCADAGFLLTETALRTMANQARQLGATFTENTPALSWGTSSDGVFVDTPSGRISAGALIVTAGAWASRMLADIGLPLEVRRKTLWWQAVENPADFAPDRFPVYICDSDAGEIYGFPVYGRPGLKIANHKDGEPVDPETVDRSTHPGENADCLHLAEKVIPAILPEVLHSAVCLYTMTPDTDFIVDRYPNEARIAIGAGFSGHGFKFTPAIGELLANIVLDTNSRPIPRLALSRFNL